MIRGYAGGVTTWRARRRLRGLTAGSPSSGQRVILRRPRLTAVGAAGVVGGSVWALAGPVAGLVAATYSVVTVVYVLRRRAGAIERQARALALDAVALLAADLRAGLDPPTVRASARPAVQGVRVVSQRVSAAWSVADVTGAPLADLLDRLQAELRDLERLRLAATARAAGIRATAVLLAALPIAGIALGYGMGADPSHVLLHTPLGAGCAAAATALQVAGFCWTDRLGRVAP